LYGHQLPTEPTEFSPCGLSGEFKLR
jgi:hypothetical protein